MRGIVRRLDSAATRLEASVGRWLALVLLWVSAVFAWRGITAPLRSDYLALMVGARILGTGGAFAREFVGHPGLLVSRLGVESNAAATGGWTWPA